MCDWVQVSKATFNQMAKNFNAEWTTHGFTVANRLAGRMEVVEHYEDCMFFDYFVTEKLYHQYEAECV